jgi:Lon protease-like protein
MGQTDDAMMREVANYLQRVQHACDVVGLDEERKKMIVQTLVFGAPINNIADLQPLPDVSSMRMALETVQTWFNAGNLRTPALDAELMMQMNAAGYPIVGGQ